MGLRRPARLRSHRRLLVVLGCGTVAAALGLAGPIAAALAGTDLGPPTVSATQTVKANLTANGQLDGQPLVFTQVTATGKGPVDAQVPTSTKGTRNLDGFSGAPVKQGAVVLTTTVDGTKQVRTVSTSTAPLPVDVEAVYTLNGVPVAPSRLAGRSGVLGVTYHVKNVTAEPTKITYQDGQGKQVTDTVDLVTPYVGQLQLDLPSSFSRISTSGDRADAAGDGRGGVRLTWTMVLFEPIGQVEQTLGFQAQVSDAVIPPASIQVVPVPPQNHPELKFGQDGFKAGAASGTKVTQGAVQIDANLLKLQAGASVLMAGLTKLASGATQLSNGLTTQAVPGSAQLASGSAQLAAGSQQLASGLSAGVPAAVDGSARLAAGAKQAASGAQQLAQGTGQAGKGASQLADGSAQLAAGLTELGGKAPLLENGAGQVAGGAAALAKGFNDPSASTDLTRGSQELAVGARQLSAGLALLAGPDGLPALQAGAKQLMAAVDKIVAGIGSPTTPDTILYGLAQLTGGNEKLQAGAATLVAPSGLPAALGGVEAVKAGLDKALAAGGGIDQLAAGVAALTRFCGAIPDQTTSAQCAGVGQATAAGVSSLREQTGAAADGLGQVATGLGTAIGGIGTGSSPAPDTLRGGLAAEGAGLAQVTAGVKAVRAGLSSGSSANPGVAEGLAQLEAGLGKAVAAAVQLAQGAAQLATGSTKLALGIATAGQGAAQLATGAGQLDAGIGQLSAKVPAAVSGAQALASGSSDLATGLNQQLVPGSNLLASSLSGQLAPGAALLASKLTQLTAAETGAQALNNGLQQLSAGASTLSTGLSSAATGSQQLATGLDAAQAGAGKIESGAGQLSSEGTKKLVAAGNETAATFAREYATMKALDARGTDVLPYGQATGVTNAQAAYDLTLAGVGHPGAVNSGGRAGIALAVLAGAAGLATVLRRVLL